MLFASLVEKAIESRCDELTLEVRVSNRIAQNLYTKYGLEVTGRRTRYYPDNHEDAWIMCFAPPARRGISDVILGTRRTAARTHPGRANEHTGHREPPHERGRGMSPATSEPPRRTILITNDDGIASAGLRELARALAPVGEVEIIAPEHNWSASGHSKTMHKPLRVTPAHLADGTPALAASGSPSDCVALALLGILDHRPDLVVSGINQGANVGHDLTYSGTVSAAMEAVIAGIPAIAISLDSFESHPYDVAAGFAALLASKTPLRAVRTAAAAQRQRSGPASGTDLRSTGNPSGTESVSRRVGTAHRPAGPLVLLDWRRPARRGSRGRDGHRRAQPGLCVDHAHHPGPDR